MVSQNRTCEVEQAHMGMHHGNNLQRSHCSSVRKRKPLAQGRGSQTERSKPPTSKQRTVSMGAAARLCFPSQDVQSHHLARPVHRTLAKVHQETISALLERGRSLQATPLCEQAHLRRLAVSAARRVGGGVCVWAGAESGLPSALGEEGVRAGRDRCGGGDVGGDVGPELVVKSYCGGGV